MFLHPTAVGRVYLAQYTECLSFAESFEIFTLDSSIAYQGYCDDFGPMNMSCIIDFIRLLDAKLDESPAKKIIFSVENGKRAMTNAVFLLGAYMILKLGKTSAAVSESFRWLDTDQVEPYRDATYSRPDFALELIDCWRGLEKGMERGWVRFAGSDFMWGEIDVDEHRHYDDPANGDLQEVVPGKFIALKGPVATLDGREYHDDARGARSFSPAFYAEILHGMGVSAVVRLNEPRYAAEALTSQGFAHHSLEFPDCTCPPDAVVAAFLRIVDAAPGAVAVHCHAGLGRTGTLIALYLMRSCDFRAREAMGWLRIMRPGSVIGEQQHYLCAVDAALQTRRRRASGAGAVSEDPSSAAAVSADGFADGPALRTRSQSAPDAVEPSVLAAQVCAGMLRRAASSDCYGDAKRLQ
jgi:cell division cycle 14